MLHDRMTGYINLREIFEYAHLKFTVNGQSKHNLVPMLILPARARERVWRSERLLLSQLHNLRAQIRLQNA